MIQFPETAIVEWEAVEDAAKAEVELRKALERGTRIEKEVENLRVRHESKLIFQAELDADSTPVLEMGTLADYQSNPSNAPVELIEGVMKEDGLLVVVGASGSGKTTLALQALHSLLTGDSWLGQPVKQINGSVGILSYDMDASMVYDWMSGAPNIDPTKISVVNAYKRGHPLGVPAMRQQIVNAWKAMQVEVILIDSFSASFFGDNQNDAAQTMAHYRDLKLFALTEVGAKALIVIAHSTEGSQGKVRGSSVHKDTADTMVGVHVDPDTPMRTVKMEKYRAARGQTQMSPVIVTAPDDVTHLVSLDPNAMQLAGYPLPAGVGATAFTPMPQAHQAPDTESEEDDL